MTPRTPREGGFTLIEILVVVALIAILGVLAAPSFSRVAASSALSGTATSFATSVMQARSEAIRSSRRTFVSPATGTSWASGWTVWIDTNANGTFDSGTDTVVGTTPAVDSRVTTDSVSTTSISFDPTGFPTSGTSGCVAFQLTPNAWGEKARQVVLATAGRVRIAQATVGTSCPAS